jgi:voltage-gated potassium channel Kch
METSPTVQSAPSLPPQGVVAPVEVAAVAPTSPSTQDTAEPKPTVVIVGFGLPGRFVAEVLDARQVPYTVVELNPSNAKSIAACNKPVLCGDARDPNLLRQAGIETAKFLAVTLPDERMVLEVLQIARQINPSLKMLARVNYTSTGMKAERAGATGVVVEEQIVALEFAKLMGSSL